MSPTRPTDGRPAPYEPGAPPVFVGPCGAERRARLLELPIGIVSASHHLHGDAECGLAISGMSSRFLVVLPYRGLVVWQVGREEVVGDANQVLFVTRGEDYRVTGPVPSGYGYLILTPQLGALAELARTTEAHLPAHPLFRRRSRRADRRLQALRARFLHWASHASDADALEAEELVLALLRPALDAELPHSTACGPTTARLVRRAKEFLEAELSSPIRLADVAQAVGASPAYLTHTFGVREGVSLHQYLMRLRLARALVELPHVADLTALALDVGFSSHSHFAAAFRRRFGCTPSQFREMARSAVRHREVGHRAR
jgi:AraC family transcriptional regulator